MSSLPEPEVAIAIAGLVLGATVVASRVSSRVGVPVLVLFLAMGMLAGSDGPGGIHFDDPHRAQLVGVVCLVLILFSGGLSTAWSDVRPVLAHAAALSTVGVIITAAIVGAAAVWLLDLSWQAGLLLGAIVSSTDAAAVFTVLRGRAVNLRPPTPAILELESGGNDPMAAFLTVAFIDLQLHPHRSIPGLVLAFVLQAVVGGLGGYAIGRVAVWAVNGLHLDFEGLYPVVTVAVALLAFGGADLLGGSGFLAAYVAGLTMAAADFVHRRSLQRFHDALAWLAQIAMFLALGLLVFPARLFDNVWQALAVALVLVVLARPVAVILALAPAKLPWRDRALISWVGLRGAVPIVLATFPLVRGVAKADLIFDVVFFVVIVSVLLQGTTTPFVARRLGVLADRPPPPFPIEAVSTAGAGAGIREFTVEPQSRADGAEIMDVGLANGVLVVLVNRGDAFVIPQGSTQLRAGDRVLLVGDADGQSASAFSRAETAWA